jgi:hypothetical protein
VRARLAATRSSAPRISSGRIEVRWAAAALSIRAGIPASIKAFVNPTTVVRAAGIVTEELFIGSVANIEVRLPSIAGGWQI